MGVLAVKIRLTNASEISFVQSLCHVLYDKTMVVFIGFVFRSVPPQLPRGHSCSCVA